MNRIIALNEDTDSNSSDGDQLQVTKEAEETIAVSEYIRALNFKKDNKIEDALILFRDLLDIQVLHEVTKDDKDNKLFYVKYNCYKNLGFVYMEKGENDLALDHLLSAFELDDTDVFAMNKLGQLALEMNKLEVAQIAFEKCLKQNPNHWPSGDGVLQVLCLQENYNEAYGWALMWYEKDNNYQRALDVILEIREKFNNFGLDYIENNWLLKFTDTTLKRKNKKSMFPGYSVIEPEPIKKPDFSEFRIETLSWLSVGNYIVNVYEKFEQDIPAICYDLTLDDILINLSTLEKSEQIKSTNEVLKSPAPTVIVENGVDVIVISEDIQATDDQQKLKDNSNSDVDAKFLAPFSEIQTQTSAEGSAEDSDMNSKQNETTDAKPKQVRRRGSDLSFLEQWGWHKNRRYVQRKKSNDKNEAEINGILRRTLAKYFEDNFDNELPFVVNKTSEECSEDFRNDLHQTKHADVTVNEFQEKTEEAFNYFVNELKAKHFDTMSLIFKWAQYISKFWEQKIPIEIQEIYMKIYIFYLNHYDLCTWNLLDSKDFKAAFRMTLFYVELFHDRALQKSKYGIKNEVNERWFMLYNHVLFHSGFYDIDPDSEEEFSKYQKRLYWLQYCLAKYEYDLKRAVDCLYTMEELIKSSNSNFELDFPNQHQNSLINLATIDNIKLSLERTISINNVKKLYEEKKFEDLIVILTDSLINSAKSRYNDTPLKIITQIEVLLEALWNLEYYVECLIWSERCLKYSLDNFLEVTGDTKQREWAEIITFILIYIEALINSETIAIVTCLDKYFSRLIQSLTKIVSHQLDGTFDKNNNRLHPINTKIPWVILHQILQREEDRNPIVTRKSSKTNVSEGEETEDVIPCSIMVFFTAHEFLGLRSWCTKHNGELLLYTLDVVATRLRAPYLEPFRDIISEYLEQVTYCLYGYPAKRARARHIEEHDAQNVELNWERAIQLFDLYRPDKLPEFNSYKNDSISADMEQLFQRIVNLIPSEVDPNSHISAIQNVINGTSELPQPFSLLPYRINSIFYLLADYYFKNRDFAKSVKYYILDLTTCPTRFDSWAGLALSKTSILETKLNSCGVLCTNEYLSHSEDVLRCFQQCFKLDKNQVLLWIEYGNFAYSMHSFCSRSLKQSSATLSIERFESMEAKKDQCLKIAYDCFDTVEQSTNHPHQEDSHDEKWLYHYMLGKIAEKRKEQPEIYLNHYIKAAQYLYENNASYPFRISHSYPQHLSVECLEIFYRITSSIIKYVEQHSTITRGVGKYFIKILKEVGSSPFALNKAKIDDSSINALKRKLSQANEEAAKKMPKIDEVNDTDIPEPINNEVQIIDFCAESEPMDITTPLVENVDATENNVNPIDTLLPIDEKKENTNDGDKLNSPSRRGSQESNATTGTTTTGSDTTSSSSSDSSSSESSSSESDSDSSDEDDKNNDSPLNENELESIYKTCIRNLEECVTRFPEHYKSINRLVNIYLNAPDKLKDLKKCKQLLLGTYTTGLANQIQGLFFDRRINNFFNGIWRIPSPEIDRPGSFSAHLSKCIIILMEVLRLSMDHKILLEFALQIQRNPDSDKRYIKDAERKELFQQAISFCIQSFRKLLKIHGTDKRDDKELLNLLIEMYKSHKKCIKHMMQKENLFTSLIIDAYKIYIQEKVTKIPDNVNIFDLAAKLCQYENAKKTQAKNSGTAISLVESAPVNINKTTVVTSPSTTLTTISTTIIPTTTSTSNISSTTTTTAIITTIPSASSYVPAVSRPRGRPPGSKNVNHISVASNANSFLPRMDASTMAAMVGLCNNPALMPSMAQYSDPAAVNALLNEFYKLSNMTGMSSLLTRMGQSNLLPSTQQQNKSSPNPIFELPQMDMKSLISSAASIAATTGVGKTPSSTVISVGSGQLTITPTMTMTKSMPHKDQVTNTNFVPLLADKVSKSHQQSGDKSYKSISPQSEILPSNISSKIFSDMPGISVTKVKPKTVLLPQNNVSIPKDLPKSLTITPTPAGYTSKPQTINQTPHITLQPEKPISSKDSVKSLDKSKKKQAASYYRSATQYPLQLPYAYNMPNFTQQLALFNQYSDLMKSLTPAQFADLSNLTKQTKPQVSKPQKAPKSTSSSATTSKSSISIKQMQALQQPAHSSRSVPSQKHFPMNVLPKQSPSPKLQTFSMPDIVKNISPFSAPLSTSPILAHSPNKSPILHRQSVTPPGHHQTSPTKTLQQKLAERKALNDANMLQQQQGTRPGNGRSTDTSMKQRKNDGVINLD